jgi:hypothetical protein
VRWSDRKWLNHALMVKKWGYLKIVSLRVLGGKAPRLSMVTVTSRADVERLMNVLSYSERPARQYSDILSILTNGACFLSNHP